MSLNQAYLFRFNLILKKLFVALKQPCELTFNLTNGLINNKEII